MNVKDKYKCQHEPGYSIEWGTATWDDNSNSIRNRYDDTVSGRFNKAGSSEVPWNDFKLMISQSILRNHFTKAELAAILNDIATVMLKP